MGVWLMYFLRDKGYMARDGNTDHIISDYPGDPGRVADAVDGGDKA